MFLFCWHPRATSQGRDPPSRLRGLPGSRLCTFDGRMFCGGAWPKAVDQFRPLSLSLSQCSFIVHFSLDIGIDKQRRQVNLPIHSALVDRMGIAKKKASVKNKKVQQSYFNQSKFNSVNEIVHFTRIFRSSFVLAK